MRLHTTRGFSLIELLVTVLVMGMILAVSIPAFRGYRESHLLSSTARNIAGQLRLAREKAIATGTMQTIHFTEDYLESDYHIHNGSLVNPKWLFPKGIQYYWGTNTYWEYRMATNGRCLDSGLIILQDRKGNRDTVAIQSSGLVLIP